MEEKRTMPICFTSDHLKLMEEYAKKRGMLNVSQAIEDLITNKKL
jgi:phenolic acid decarboxylase